MIAIYIFNKYIAINMCILSIDILLAIVYNVLVRNKRDRKGIGGSRSERWPNRQTPQTCGPYTSEEVPVGANNSDEDDRRPIPEDLDHRREKDMKNSRWMDLLEEKIRNSERFMEVYAELNRIPRKDYEAREAKIRELNTLNEIGARILKEMDQAS